MSPLVVCAHGASHVFRVGSWLCLMYQHYTGMFHQTDTVFVVTEILESSFFFLTKIQCSFSKSSSINVVARTVVNAFNTRWLMSGLPSCLNLVDRILHTGAHLQTIKSQLKHSSLLKAGLKMCPFGGSWYCKLAILCLSENHYTWPAPLKRKYIFPITIFCRSISLLVNE